MAEESGGNATFTSKELLVRIDAKVDGLMQTTAQKHAHYDVELALLKARTVEAEADIKNLQATSREEIEKLQAEVEITKERQNAILTRINIAAGAVGFIIFLSPLVWILINHLVNGPTP